MMLKEEMVVKKMADRNMMLIAGIFSITIRHLFESPDLSPGGDQVNSLTAFVQ